MSLKKIIPLLFIVAFLVQNASATLIAPPSSFAEMLSNARTVVYGQVISHASEDGYLNNFKILRSLKGDLEQGSIIPLKEYSSSDGPLYNIVSGDVNYEIGERYLIFLYQDGDGTYKAEMLALSVYKEGMRDGQKILAHTDKIMDICFADDVRSELTGAYLSQSLIKSIDRSVRSNQSWRLQGSGFLAENGSFYDRLKAQHAEHHHDKSAPCPNNPPSHCTTLFGSPGNLDGNCNFSVSGGSFTPISPGKFSSPNFTVKLANTASSDPSTPNEIANIANAVTALDGFAGLNVAESSPLIQSCNTTSCTSAASAAQSCNSSLANDIWIMLDDPCNQIPSLSGCSGTLGFGGSFVFNSCHTDACGNQWLNSAIPYFVMNDGAGCLGDDKYTAVLIHEMLHSVSLDHISGSCTALMNPFICSSTSANFGITNLDEACVDWMYNAGAAPACDISNLNLTTTPSCNGPDVDFSLAFDVVNGSGTYDLFVGGSFISSIGGTANGTVTASLTNVSLPSGLTNFEIRDNSDPSCSDITAGPVPDCSAPGPCDNGTVNITFVTPGLYDENDVINTTAIVNVSPVTFEAQDEINMTAPFEVKPTSDFLADIVPCN